MKFCVENFPTKGAECRNVSMLYGTMLLEAGSHECRRLMLNNNRREVEKEVRMKIEGACEIVRWY